MAASRSIAFVCGVVAVGALGLLLRTWRHRQSPQSSLEQLADAAQRHDPRTVAQYVDMRRVAESIVDAAISAGSLVGDGGVPRESGAELRGSLVEVMEQAAWTAVSDPPTWLDYRALTEGITTVERHDHEASVGVRVRLPNLDSAVVVRLRMVPAGGRWRVIGINDLVGPMAAAGERAFQRSYVAVMKSDLRNLVTAEAIYFNGHQIYTTSLNALGFVPTPGASLSVTEAGSDGWRAIAQHTGATIQCQVAIGRALRAGEVAGQPSCAIAGR